MTRNNTQDTTNTNEKEINISDIRSVTLDPKDAWHEVECPYCVNKNLVEPQDTPVGCGKCTHCKNTVRLVNDIDIQYVTLTRTESIHDTPCPCCEKTNTFNTLKTVPESTAPNIDGDVFETTCTHCSEIIHVTFN